MEFLLQLMAELFGGEAINETENVTTNPVMQAVEVDKEQVVAEMEELEEPNFFTVMQFL